MKKNDEKYSALKDFVESSNLHLEEGDYPESLLESYLNQTLVIRKGGPKIFDLIGTVTCYFNSHFEVTYSDGSVYYYPKNEFCRLFTRRGLLIGHPKDQFD